jgi:hypothetical protein
MRGIAHEAPAFRQSRSAPAFVSRIEFLKLPGSAHLLNHHVEPHNGGTRPGDRNIVRRQRRAQGGLLIALGRRWPLGPEPGQRPDGPLWPRAGRFGVNPPSSRDGAGDLAAGVDRTSFATKEDRNRHRAAGREILLGAFSVWRFRQHGR